jgi:predicted acyl esterase
MLRLVHRLVVLLAVAWPAMGVAQRADDVMTRLSKQVKLRPAKTYMVPMRDGVKLATDVMLPTSKPGARWPALVVRTPYNRQGGVGRMAGLLVPPAGFAAVVQDIRGRFGSEGEDYPVHGGCGWGHVQDGYDTIEWVAKQPWCNGKVGTVGPSAMGATQNLTLPTQPPHLTCAFVMVAWADIYKHAAYWGGAPRVALPEGWIRGNTFDPRNLDLFRTHPSYDEFWEAWNTESLAHRIDIPVLYFGGWYDHFCQGTIDSFLAVQARGGPIAKKESRLIMGPWTHDGIPKGLTYPDNANPRYDKYILKWFSRHLKGVDAGGGTGHRVNYYVMGASGEADAPGNEWRSADVWPVPNQSVPYYLHEGGSLSTDVPTGRQASATYQYDPKNPAPTLCGGVLTPTSGILDQRPVEKRPDVLVFTTPVLTEPVEATGRISVKLWASSSCTDTDFTAKLTDVYPDGRSLLVLDGIVRARYRDSLRTPTLIEPGKAYLFEIDLWSTSIIFNKGHRIRVAISSSNAQRFRPNPNTGEAVDGVTVRVPSGKSLRDPTLMVPDQASPFEMTKAVVARNTIYFDKDHPSHIILPRPTVAAMQ